MSAFIDAAARASADAAAVSRRLAEVERERDEARAVAREFYADLRAEVGDYVWEKHYAVEVSRFPWLKEQSP